MMKMRSGASTRVSPSRKRAAPTPPASATTERGSSVNVAQPRDPLPSVFYLMSKIQCDEQRRGAFQITSIVEWTGIDGVHTGNRFGNLAHGRFCFRVVAADQRVAVDRLVESREGFRAQGMKTCQHGDGRGHKSGGLLRG